MIVAPLAVLPLAAVAVVVGWVASAAGLPALVVGLLVVGTLALGSRGMHLDGLADTVDGLGSGWDRNRALEIMRRGDIGPMGAVALVIMIGLQAASIGRIVVDLRSAVLLVGAGRLRLPGGADPGLPARGTGRPDRGPRRRRGRLGAVVGRLPGLAGRGRRCSGWARPRSAAATPAGRSPRWWPPSAVLLLVWRCVRRLGGVTGDVMGAAIEIALTIMLIGVAV